MPTFETCDAGSQAPSFALVAALALVTMAPQYAHAQFTADPYADAHYEHDSNVFRAENSHVIFLASGDGTLADSDEKYLIGSTGQYLWGEQTLTGTVEGRRFEYDHYTDLDHYEYLGDVKLAWKLTSLLDGTIEGRDEQSMAGFQYGDSVTTLELNQSRKVTGLGGLNFTPDWRLEAGASYFSLKAPLQTDPDFSDREIGEHLGILYRGVTNLTYGLAVDQTQGRFENAPGIAGPYDQTQYAFTAAYNLGRVTTFTGQIGFTRRTQTGAAGSVSGVTGALGYRRQITPKTSISVNASRLVNTYVAVAGSEVDLLGNVDVLWQATYRFGVDVAVGYEHSTFVGQNFSGIGFDGAEVAGRVDHSPTESLNLTYQVLKRFKLHGYLNKSARSSNVAFYNYSDTIIGIEGKVTWR